MQIQSADVHNEKCPSRVILEIISNKWVILIIDKLAQKTHRFGELKRQIGGISPKVLTQLLKMLEKNGLVFRYCFSEVTLKVEYSLSPLGKSLSNICEMITKWAEDHIEEIVNAKKLRI